MPPQVRAGVTPRFAMDKPVGEWNRFFIRMQGDRLTVVLNGVTVIEKAASPAWPSVAGCASHGGVEFTNVLVRKLH